MNQPDLEWLLEDDVAVRFQTRRDLLHRNDVQLQERIAREGEGAALLAARHADGHWGRGSTSRSGRRATTGSSGGDRFSVYVTRGGCSATPADENGAGIAARGDVGPLCCGRARV